MNTILVADDELEVREFLGLALGCDGFDVEFSENGNEVLSRVRAGKPDLSLILLDLLMPYKDGLDTLEELHRIRPDLPVIVLSGACSPPQVSAANKHGAVDFLTKPVSPGQLSVAIRKAIPAEARAAQAEAADEGGGQLPVMGSWGRKLDLLLNRIGGSDVPVLLRGETGVGKEVLARSLWAISPRSRHLFLKLNCAALPSELVESELFGYERGAFTGAFKNTPGKFEMANRGTILLDEIGDMDFRLQAKLLQVVQDREFLRLGAKETTKVDVRVMAATHCDLEKAIEDGRFREDLYYRLNTIDIHIPPLRDRQDEILPLAEYFLRLHGGPDCVGLTIPPGLRYALLDHPWPGNIRELENVIRKFLVMGSTEAVVEDLRRRARRVVAAHPSTNQVANLAAQFNEVLPNPEPAARACPPPEPTAAESQSVLKNVSSAHKAAEAEAIMAALRASMWNRKQAAAILKIEYKALLYKMKKLGIGEKKHPQ